MNGTNTAFLPENAIPRCEACQSEAALKVWSVNDHEYGVPYAARYSECADCGTLTQSPMPSPEQLSSFYPDDYHSFAGDNMLMRARYAMRLRRLSQLLPLLPDSGVILDYGCGGGAFLRYAASRLTHLSFVGYEIGDRDESEVFAGERVKIFKGSIDHLMANLPGTRLVILNHVIEHLPSPADVLGLLANRLVRGGMVDGQTPGADSLERAAFGVRWAGFHAPRHTVVFSRPGLVALFKRLGFDDIRVEGAFNPGGIAISLASAMHGKGPAHISRKGPVWLSYVGAATLLAPLDLLSGKPGILNFRATKSH